MKIEIINMYKNDGWGYADDFCPMYYYKITSNGEVISETDWDYGFADVTSASAYMEIYYPGKQFAIVFSD